MNNALQLKLSIVLDSQVCRAQLIGGYFKLTLLVETASKTIFPVTIKFGSSGKGCAQQSDWNGVPIYSQSQFALLFKAVDRNFGKSLNKRQWPSILLFRSYFLPFFYRYLLVSVERASSSPGPRVRYGLYLFWKRLKTQRFTPGTALHQKAENLEIRSRKGDCFAPLVRGKNLMTLSSLF